MKCQACDDRTYVERVEDDDPDEPYLVCRNCAERLRLLALRPAEWFNIASKHGWQKYLLHDDFYDEDGTAVQPKMEGFLSDDMAAPSLDEAALSAEGMLDYCITRWRLGQTEFDALRILPPETLFVTLQQRVSTGNAHILQVGLRICANVLGALAADWVDDQYERSCEQEALVSWAEAAAGCLPLKEGLKKTTDALTRYQGRELQERMYALSWFRAPSVLNLIERNAPQTNVSRSWGQLAALSQLNWARAEAWLTRGRPLNLVALDALDQFFLRPRHAPIVRELQPMLMECSDRSIIVQALELQMLNDPAPRVVKTCKYLIKHVNRLGISDQD